MLTDEKLARLREAAEDCPHPTPWSRLGHHVLDAESDVVCHPEYGSAAAFLAEADPTTVLALLDRNAELEAENAALCRANTEERARRKAAEARVKHLEREHTSHDAEMAKLKWRNDHARKCEADVVAYYEPNIARLIAERDAARATVERVRALAVRLEEMSRHDYHEGRDEPGDSVRNVRAWEQHAAARAIEAALTPPGDGGGHG